MAATSSRWRSSRINRIVFFSGSFQSHLHRSLHICVWGSIWGKISESNRKYLHKLVKMLKHCNGHLSQFPAQVKDARELGTQLWLSEWFIWPPAQFVNFYFLPTKYRVIYDNLVSLFYDWYTSHLKHNKATAEGPNGQSSQPLEDQSEGLRSVLWQRLGPPSCGGAEDKDTHWLLVKRFDPDLK